jgi:pyruvate/2-oxoglutarate dehydrogenase complex dihydrolipoamide acyltransferase (E2) component
VYIEDVDDNAPIFYPTQYNISVARDVPVGHPLLVVSATDADAGSFGTIEYTLVSSSDLFRIDNRTGACLYVRVNTHTCVCR